MEDLIKKIADEYLWIFSRPDNNFFNSLVYRIEDEIPLTTKQVYAFKKIVISHIEDIKSNIRHTNVEQVIRENNWIRQPVASVEYKPEARLVKGNIVALRVTTNPSLRADLKDLNAVYSGGANIVVVNNVKNLNKLINVIGQYNIQIDEKLEIYLSEAMALTGKDKTCINIRDDALYISAPNDDLFAQYCDHILGLKDV